MHESSALGSIARLLSEEHVELEALLVRALAPPGAVDLDAFGGFRARLLRHIAVEEKVLLPALREARGGVPHPSFVRLRIDHGAVTSLLVGPPTRELIREIRAVLEPHDALEEGPGGLYDGCDDALGGRGEAPRCAARRRCRPHQHPPSG